MLISIEWSGIFMSSTNKEILRKPDWLKIKLNTNENYLGLKNMMREKNRKAGKNQYSKKTDHL